MRLLRPVLRIALHDQARQTGRELDDFAETFLAPRSHARGKPHLLAVRRGAAGLAFRQRQGDIARVFELQKAAHTLESAMEDEGDIPVRYIAYANVQEKLGNDKKMVEALKHTTKLQPNQQTYSLVAGTYRKIGREDNAKKIESAVKKAKVKIQKAPKIKQPRKVVM